MKKVLSVLLILAAIFGFYGGGVSLNDVLACKDYWEEEGEKTTADLNKLEDGLDELGENTEAYIDGLDQVAEGEKELAAGEKTLSKALKAFKAAPKTLAEAKKSLAALKESGLQDGIAQINQGYSGLFKPGFEALNGARIDIVDSLSEMADTFGESEWENVEIAEGVTGAKLSEKLNAVVKKAGSCAALHNNVGSVIYELKDVATKLGIFAEETTDLKLKNAAAKYAGELGSLNPDNPGAIAKITVWNGEDNYGKLDPTKQTILAGGCSKIATGICGNETLKGLVQNSKGGAQAIQLLSQFVNTSASGQEGTMKLMSLGIDEFNGTVAAMNEIFQKVNAGIERLKAQYAKGVADYKAAPKQIADGKKKLASGRSELADGKAQLAEYEDGEQQIRDGLATLMETEANGGLTSIEDRIGADEDFSLEDGNLDFDAGYNGVDTGREYSADSSVLITKELTQRAVGFGIGIGGGVLALVAAILGFLKKNKGAAVLGLLAAVAAAAGAFVAKSAGLEFSAIAGSALGATPLVALGILAVVAVLHAIAYFTAPKAA